MRLWASGVGLWVEGLGFPIWDLGLRVWRAGCRVKGSCNFWGYKGIHRGVWGLGFGFLTVMGPFWGPKALGFYSSLVHDESCFVVLQMHEWQVFCRLRRGRLWAKHSEVSGPNG